MKATTILLCIIALSLCACSNIRLNKRKGLDLHLEKRNYLQLSGTYQNISSSKRTCYGLFKEDSLFRKHDYTIKLVPINKNKLLIKLVDSPFEIDSVLLKGKLRRGYFKIKPQWQVQGIAGPFLWILSDQVTYVGLNKENKLVTLDSGYGGVMFLLAFPVMANGTGQIVNEYERINQ